MIRRIATDPDTVVYRISGAFFFGGGRSTVATMLDRNADQRRNFVLGLFRRAVPRFDRSQC